MTHYFRFGKVSITSMTVTPIHMLSRQHEIAAISWVIMAHTLGMFGLSFVVGWLVDRVGRVNSILAGCVLLTIACIIAPLSIGIIQLALALFLLGLGWNFTYIAGSALLDDLLRSTEKGRIQGSVDAIVNFASGVASLGSGVAFSAIGFRITSWATILFALIPVALLLLLRSSGNKLPLRRASSG